MVVEQVYAQLHKLVNKLTTDELIIKPSLTNVERNIPVMLSVYISTTFRSCHIVRLRFHRYVASDLFVKNQKIGFIYLALLGIAPVEMT